MIKDLEGENLYAEECKVTIESEELSEIKMIKLESGKISIQDIRPKLEIWGNFKNMQLRVGRSSKDGKNVHVLCQEGNHNRAAKEKCNFRMNYIWKEVLGGYCLKSIYRGHNHLLREKRFGYKDITETHKLKIEDLSKKGLNSSQISGLMS